MTAVQDEDQIEVFLEMFRLARRLQKSNSNKLVYGLLCMNLAGRGGLTTHNIFDYVDRAWDAVAKLGAHPGALGGEG